MKPTKPAIQISDADRQRKILITVKCIMAFKKWREKASPSGKIGTGALKVAVYIKSCPQKPRLQKTKTALKQETYNLSDLKHDPHCGFVEQVWRLGTSRSHPIVVTSTIDSKTF